VPTPLPVSARTSLAPWRSPRTRACVRPSAVFELVFFWGVGCPHCEEAKPFVDTLERERPDLRVVRVESRKDPEGRRRFVDTMNGLGASAVGVPTFVVGERYVTGFVKGESEAQVRSPRRDTPPRDRGRSCGGRGRHARSSPALGRGGSEERLAPPGSPWS
jgi:glutaredoxin